MASYFGGKTKQKTSKWENDVANIYLFFSALFQIQLDFCKHRYFT